MKNLLLFTSNQVGDTGTVSWNFLFQDDFKSFEKFPKHMASPFFGMFKDPNDGGDQISFNIFEASKGFHMAGPISDVDPEINNRIVNDFPEYFYMLCTKSVADRIIKNLEGLDIKIDVLYSEKTLTTS